MKTSIQFATIVAIATCDPYSHGTPGHSAPAPASVSCPAGFQLVGKNCEQTVTAPIQLSCVAGQLTGEHCAVYAPLQRQCPIGTVPHGKECAIQQITAASKFCPEGYTDQGATGCMASQQLPLIQFCEIGAMDASGQCLLVETSPPILKTFCPPGFQDQGKGCMQVTEYDCSPPIIQGKGLPPPPPPPLPLPTFPYKKNKKRMLGAKKYAVYAPLPVPIPPPSKGAALVAPLPPPPKVAVVKQLCQRQDFAPPITEQYCPSGFSEIGKNCVAKKSFPPVQRCANGRPASECVEHISAAHVWACHEGQLVGEQCQTHYTVPMEVVCPAGTQIVGDQCASYLPPQQLCPQGLQMENGICYGKQITEPNGIVTVPCTGKSCWQGHAHL